MPFYKVRAGQQVGHNGQTLEAGTVIEVSAYIGYEVREKLEPCTKDGESLAHLSPDELKVAQAAPHERDGLAKALGLPVPDAKPEPVPVRAAETKASTVVEGAEPSDE